MAEDRMPDAEYRLISKNYIYLMERLHARVLTGHLHQNGVLSHDDLYEIHKQDDLSRRAGVELLLTKLHFVGGCSAFKHFVASLKANGYHRAVELLESTDVDNQTSTSSKQDLQQVVNQQREEIEHHRQQILQLTLKATGNEQMVHTLQSILDKLKRSPNNQSCAIRTLEQEIQTLKSGAKEAECERKMLTDEMLALQIKVDTSEAKQEVGASTSGAAGISRPHAGVVGASGINKLQVEAESRVKTEDKVVTLRVYVSHKIYLFLIEDVFFKLLSKI
ncbi:hypothetical protein SNE40_013567 [Patella caerulea]|uniref:CARD domain-containing protein n=1 Tax=Patella caerulea TaxID=87958 RepID=A0AAN8JG72_PATCE